MASYSLASKEVLDSIKQYTKSGEEVKTSDFLEYNNILYREIIFSKKWSKNELKERLEYLYINEKNEIVIQKTLQDRLAKLAYFWEIFYNTENKSCIVNAFQDEGAVEKDNKNYKLVTDGLDILTKDGIVDSQQVKQMVLKLPGIKRKY
jgi:NCAIR mutase (PurE)-related protein